MYSHLQLIFSYKKQKCTHICCWFCPIKNKNVLTFVVDFVEDRGGLNARHPAERLFPFHVGRHALFSLLFICAFSLLFICAFFTIIYMLNRCTDIRGMGSFYYKHVVNRRADLLNVWCPDYGSHSLTDRSNNHSVIFRYFAVILLYIVYKHVSNIYYS